MPSRQDQIKAYYHTTESRWGYRLVLGGAKHFGYYPDGRHLSARQALSRMEHELGASIGLPAGSRILDAGSGMGRVATHLAAEFGYNIDGIDLLDFNVTEARRYAAKHGQTPRFLVGDYAQLPYPDNTFDAVYTIETFSHAPDYQAAYREFHRVLKPGGKLVQYEYSVAPGLAAQPSTEPALASIIADSAMHALPHLTHGEYLKILPQLGFVSPTETDITPHILPMLRWFHRLAIIPHQLFKFLKISPHKYTNTRAAVEFWRCRASDTWRFVVVTATKQP